MCTAGWVGAASAAVPACRRQQAVLPSPLPVLPPGRLLPAHPPTPRALMLLLLIVVASVFPRPTAAQQQAPLKGSGVPDLATTDVWVSCLLERLIKVNALEYTHTTVLYFFITWVDPQAHQMLQDNTARMRNGTRACSYPCSNLVDFHDCCDEIYRPSFAFRNALGFSQDRAVNYRMEVRPSGAIFWEVQVQGTFYQPFDLRNYPFDSMHLIVDVEFVDTSLGLEGHPGVVLHTSAASTRLYSTGRGDSTNEFFVKELNLAMLVEHPRYYMGAGDTSNEFAVRDLGIHMLVERPSAVFEHAEIPSAWDDPLPIKPVPGALGEHVFEDVTRHTDILQITITIERFWRFHVISSILPVVLCSWLGFLVFCIDTNQLAARLEVIVTLFLALAAVQFVISAGTVASSYVLPTQQLVLSSYALLATLSMESILVYQVVSWEARRLQKKGRDVAAARYVAWSKAQREAERADGGRGQCLRWGRLPRLPVPGCLRSAAVAAGEEEEQEGGAGRGGRERHPADGSHGSEGRSLRECYSASLDRAAREAAAEEGSAPGASGPTAGSASNAEAAAGSPRPGGVSPPDIPLHRLPDYAKPRNSIRFGPAKLQRRLSATTSRRFSWIAKPGMTDELAHDYQAYLDRCSALVDSAMACGLFLGYNLIALLIFVTQHGYVELLHPDLEYRSPPPSLPLAPMGPPPPMVL